MAKSYYKQSERPVVEGVNWGQISSELGAKLQAESKRREDLKTQLDTESRDYMREFNDTPQGQHDGANERMSRFADDASMYMLDLDKKLKAGQLPLRDYNAMRANLQQGTTDMFDVSKKFNADYGASLERAGSGNASAEEVYQNQQIQAFGDPANSGVYIDPVSGQMSVAKMIDDGDGNMVMSSNPSDRKSIFSLKNTVERKIDNFNVNEFSEGIKGAYDVKFQKILNDPNTSEGTKTTMLQSEDFQKATNDLISRELVNTHNAASILTNRAGKEYKFVTLANDKLPEVQEEGVIYLVPDPTNPNSGASQPLLTEKQTDEATEILRTAINSKIGVEVTEFDKEKKESQKIANKAAQQAVDYFERTEDINFEKLEVGVEADRQKIDILAQKTPLELKAMGLSNDKVDQFIKHLALKNPKELATMDLSIENTEAIMKERATKHASDMDAAKTKEEKERIELKYLDEDKSLRNQLTEAQITKINKPTQWEAKDNKEKKLVSNYVRKIGKIYDGSESEIDASLNYIISSNKDIQSINRVGDVLEVTRFVNGKPETVILPMKDKRSFIENMSALVANELDASSIMDDMGYDDTGSLTDYDNSTKVETTEDKEAGYKKEISVIVDSAISRDMFDNIDKESDFKTELLKLTEEGGSLAAFDDMVIETSKDATGKIISNEIYISFPDEETSITIDTNNWTDSGDTAEIKKLRDFLKERGKSDSSNMAKFYGFDKEGYESPNEVNYEDGKVDYTKK
jgi:hypothetical protein